MGDTGVEINEHRETPSHPEYRMLVGLDDAFIPAPAARDDDLHGSLRQAIGFFRGEAVPRQPGVRRSGGCADVVEGLYRELRALLTVRPPASVRPEGHGWLDAILQHERRGSHEVDAGDLPSVCHDIPGTWLRPSNAIALWQGDITRLAADAIVNAANAQLLGCFQPFHACIDNAIHWAAGPRLREDCGRIMAAQGHPEATGLAKITRAYNLPSRFVLHTVGPIVRGPLTEAHRRDLARCYRSCLEVAAEVRSIRTLAFCAISTGVFGFPKLPAADIAINTVAAWMPQGDFAHMHCTARGRPSCGERVWRSEPIIQRLLQRLDPDTEEVDAAVVPQCPECGGTVFFNVREDATFVETPYLEQAERCTQWVTSALSSPLLILELGAGFKTPGVVRFPLERLGARHAESRFVRINREHPDTPAQLNHRAVGIRGDAGEVVGSLWAALADRRRHDATDGSGCRTTAGLDNRFRGRHTSWN